MADDIHAEVSGWIADEIAKEAFGQSFGYAVALGPGIAALRQLASSKLATRNGAHR